MPRHKNGLKKAICQNILINICRNGESRPYKSRATESKGRNGIEPARALTQISRLHLLE